MPFFLERYAEAYRAELDAFVAGVLDATPLSPTGADGLMAQRLADAATAAASTGQALRVATESGAP
jgi:myo-inositol 2-dehydrogenase/D-chiro-inositol 1-dehydrogenase